MGMEQSVVFPAADAPGWAPVADLLARAGLPVQMRMIDGELSFPDEEPPAGWRELRIGAEGAMVTLRRGEGRVTVVAWANADEAQRRLYNAAAWALARAGGGRVQAGDGELDADAFARQAQMPPGWAGA
jgi:hypothetical protein